VYGSWYSEKREVFKSCQKLLSELELYSTVLYQEKFLSFSHGKEEPAVAKWLRQQTLTWMIQNQFSPGLNISHWRLQKGHLVKNTLQHATKAAPFKWHNQQRLMMCSAQC